MVGPGLEKILTELGLTPEEFADRIGSTKSTIYKLLRGDTVKLTRAMARKINYAFPEYEVYSLLSLNNAHKEKSPLGAIEGFTLILDDKLAEDPVKVAALVGFLSLKHDDLLKHKLYREHIKGIIKEADNSKTIREILGLLEDKTD